MGRGCSNPGYATISLLFLAHGSHSSTTLFTLSFNLGQQKRILHSLIGVVNLILDPLQFLEPFLLDRSVDALLSHVLQALLIINFLLSK